jgi:hypothetical protein
VTVIPDERRVVAPSASIPAFVQSVNASLERATGLSWTSTLNYNAVLPNRSRAGNTLIAIIQGSNSGLASGSFVVTDDQSNTWTFAAAVNDATNTWGCAIYYASNVLAATRTITIQNNLGSDFVRPQVSVREYQNVGALDTSSTHIGSSASATAGSLTPTVTGDLLLQFVCRPATVTLATSSWTAGSQANITWALDSADLRDGNAVQWGVYTSTSAINPTCTMGDSSAFLSIALAFKPLAQGGPRAAGIQILRVHHINLPGSGLAGVAGVGSAFTSPTTIAFPCSGNLLVIARISGSSTMTAVTDSKSNTWADCGEGVIQNSSVVQMWAAVNATPDTQLTLTVTHNTIVDTTLLLYDIAGAAASPIDAHASTTGSQGSPGNITSVAITPVTANGLVLGIIGVDFNTVDGLSGATYFIDSNTYNGENTSGPDCMDENNGWGHYYNPNTSQVTFTWTQFFGSPQAGSWAAMATVFKAA